MKLLYIDCCVTLRGPDSRTRALAEALLSAFREAHPQAEVETVSLESLDIHPYLLPALEEREALAAAGDFGGPVFALARQFYQADGVLVAAPFWDLSFPSILRVYIEHISANGLTYHYESDGCHGDCKASRLLYLTAGGDFEKPESLGVLYWRQLAAMFGIPRFDYVFAGGLDVDPERVPAIMAEACEEARRLGREF